MHTPQSINTPMLCSTSPPPHSTSRLNELLHLIRQWRNGTYSGPSDIVTPLDLNEYSAFKAALKTENLLSGFNKLRWCWLETEHELHIRMSESNRHGTFSCLLRELMREGVTASAEQLRRHSQAYDAIKRLQFYKAGQIEPREDSYIPDASISYISEDGGRMWILCIEVAMSQTWDNVTKKAKAYFEKHEDVDVVVNFQIPNQSGTKIPDESGTTGRRGRYQIWRRAPETSPTDWEAQSSPEFIFRKCNGAVRKGGLELRLKDFCPDIPDKEDVDIYIPHRRLVEALEEAGKLDNLKNPQPGCGKSDKGKGDERAEDEHEGDESAEDEREGDESAEEYERQERDP